MYAIATGTSPYVGVGILNYSQKYSVGNTRNFSAPTALAGTGWCVSWHPTQKYLLCGHATSPFVSILPTTNAAFGTKLADPASLPAAQPLGARFSPMGDFYASVCNTSPYLEAWGFTSEAATPIGAKSANPAVLPTAPYASAASRSIFAWSPFGNWIAMSQLASPYLYLVSFDRNTGAFGASVVPTQTLPSTVRSVAFSNDGQWIALGFATTALVYPFNQTSGAMGAPLAFQSGDTPSGVVSDLCFSADSKWIIMNGTTAAQWPWIFRLPPTQSKYYLYNQG
jgi:WD40 repeat protein